GFDSGLGYLQQEQAAYDNQQIAQNNEQINQNDQQVAQETQAQAQDNAQYSLYQNQYQQAEQQVQQAQAQVAQLSAGLGAGLQQGGGGSIDGQAMLDTAWQHAQSGIDSSLATGVQASLGNGSWASSSITDTGGVTYDPGSNMPLARYFVQPGAADGTGPQEAALRPDAQQMQRIRDLVPLIKVAGMNPSFDQDAYSQARDATEYATGQVLGGTQDAESSVARAEMLTHGLVATNLDAVQVSAVSDAQQVSQGSAANSVSNDTAGAANGLWNYGTGSVLSDLNEQLRDTVPGSDRYKELRGQVALAGSLSRDPLENMQAERALQELSMARMQDEIARYGAPLPTLRAYDPVIDERLQREEAQRQMLTSSPFMGGAYGVSSALGVSDQGATRIAIGAGLVMDVAMVAGAVYGARASSVSDSELTIAANGANGNPAAISRGLGELNSRQAAVLEQLPEFGSNTIVGKSFGQNDLAALTATTGDEFAMFSTGGRRLIYRGDFGSVPVTPELAEQLSAQGWRWSSHTHPGFDVGVLRSSPGDQAVLRAMGGNQSAVFNSMGQRGMFTPNGDSLNGWVPW
ncbi:hypothetical protein, partial [Dyella tabacisoli]